MNNSGIIMFSLAGLAVVGLIGYAVVSGPGPGQYDEFAQCLSNNEATMYGAWWCPHCTDQKELFGNSFQYVDYVECSPGRTRTTAEVCVEAGVESYPTWKFADGSELKGQVPLATLAERSGCALPEVTE